MSRVDDRDLVRDEPERARSLLTVRAAISFARDVERPCLRSLSLMCSYWRASFVPFFTPRGGMCASFCRLFGQRVVDHCVDLPAGRASFEPADRRTSIDEDEGRDLFHCKALRQSLVLVCVDADDRETAAFLACDVGDQALHPARGPRRPL